MATLTPELRTIIVQAARKHGVPAKLALAQARVESHFSPGAVSGAGAVGLFQLMPVNQTGIDPYNPAQNADRGLGLLAGLRRRFGTWDHALAAYVWGAGQKGSTHRERLLSGQWPGEVKKYVTKVNAWYTSSLEPKAGEWGFPIALGLAGIALVWYLKRRKTWPR